MDKYRPVEEEIHNLITLRMNRCDCVSQLSEIAIETKVEVFCLRRCFHWEGSHLLRMSLFNGSTIS